MFADRACICGVVYLSIVLLAGWLAGWPTCVRAASMSVSVVLCACMRVCLLYHVCARVMRVFRYAGVRAAPVSAKAQGRVTVPEGLRLKKWVSKPAKQRAIATRSRILEYRSGAFVFSCVRALRACTHKLSASCLGVERLAIRLPGCTPCMHAFVLAITWTPTCPYMPS